MRQFFIQQLFRQIHGNVKFRFRTKRERGVQLEPPTTVIEPSLLGLTQGFKTTQVTLVFCLYYPQLVLKKQHIIHRINHNWFRFIHSPCQQILG